jgi:uncharacterized protein YndB with AHSA1/START domain
MTSVDRDIPAPAAAVWDVLVDIAAWPIWGPSVRNASLRDGATELGLGVRGDVWTAVGVRMGFVITEFDPGHRWSWSVAGVPATGHQVSVTNAGCRIRFEVPWWATGYLPVCAVALRRIEKMADAEGRPDQAGRAQPVQ